MPTTYSPALWPSARSVSIVPVRTRTYAYFLNDAINSLASTVSIVPAHRTYAYIITLFLIFFKFIVSIVPAHRTYAYIARRSINCG